MTEEEIHKLLNSELDGEIEESDRLLLAGYLAREPSARLLQGELKALDKLLASMPQVEPPQGLRDDIVNKLPSVVSSETGKPRAAKIFRLWPPSAKESLKPALSIAAAIIVAVALIQLAPDAFDSRELEQASGTMVHAPGGYLVIEQPGLSASVSITPSDTQVLVSVKLESTIHTSTLIEVPKDQYTLAPLGGQGPAVAGIEINGDSLQISSIGAFEAEVLLEPGGLAVPPGENTLRVRFMQEGRTIHESMLRIPERITERKPR